jgi:hypothetical protein
MKHHLPFLIVLMLALASCSSDRFRQQSAQSAKDRTLILGISHQEALEIVRECGGQDITANIAVVGPHGEWPLTGLFWNFEQYDAVLKIAANDGTVVEIGYWTGADFSESKIHRVRNRKNLKSVTFEEQARTLKIQVLAEADPLLLWRLFRVAVRRIRVGSWSASRCQVSSMLCSPIRPQNLSPFGKGGTVGAIRQSHLNSLHPITDKLLSQSACKSSRKTFPQHFLFLLVSIRFMPFVSIRSGKASRTFLNWGIGQ